MARRFKSFVILAGMRTGSNFLEANLNALPGVHSHGEVFNPNFIGKKDQTDLFGIDLAARAADPFVLLARLKAETDGLSGFRLFHDHDPRVLAAVLDDPACAKIVLSRNPAESYVSLKIARETGQWKLSNAKNLKQAQIRFDAAEFAAHLEQAQAFQQSVLNALQISGQTAFMLDYDDLMRLEVMNGLAAYLGVAARLEALDTSLKKQNPEDISAKVENLDEMESALARLDLFNLARTAGFEPRRSPNVPAFVAVGALLFMPMRGGPTEPVTNWMSGLGAVTGDFTQKTLRDWKRAHPGHRSFTVVRHPVVRAWATYCTDILASGLPEIRLALVKTFKLPVPKDLQDAQAVRDGFIAFLRLVKLTLAGQTGLRVPPGWASQTAVLQGFAQLQSPDAVLREDRLDTGLGWVASDAGMPMAPYVAGAETGPIPLDRIYDAKVEKAVEDAYPKDYAGFGFGPYAA
jgi:LPS sulfotransferase NodH